MSAVALKADTLRKPFLVAAVVLMGLVVVVEVGSFFGLKTPPASIEQMRATISRDTSIDADTKQDMLDDLDEQLGTLNDNEKPPGLGIPYMGLLDFLMFYGLLLMALSLVVREGFQARVQGCLTLILTFVLVIASIILIILALIILIMMVSLFLAIPFGTIAYLALFGFFNRGGSDAILALLLFMKLGMCLCLFAAQQRFLLNKGLMLMAATSLLANLVVSFLHALVPVILVSITDAIAAIVVGILALIWGIVMLVGSIVSIVKVIRLP